MAFDLTRIIYDDYLPAWFRTCEAVQGTTDFDQTVTIDGDGNISIYVEGSINRAVAKVYGITKLLARVFLVAHNPDGTHHITDADIADDANIAEHKLNLCFRTIENPLNSGNNYQDSCELANVVNAAYQLGIHAQYLGSSVDAIYDELLECCLSSQAYYVSGGSGQFTGPDTYMLDPDDKVKIGFLTFNVGNIEIDLTDKYDLPVLISLRARLVSGVTTLYEGGYLHSSTTLDITAASQTDIQNFLADTNNKAFFINGTYYQWQWELITIDCSYSINGVYPSSVYARQESGLYADSTYYYFPIDMIFRYNKGLYHPRYNPNGTARRRSSVPASSITDKSLCMEQSNIAYYSVAGEECPDYSATYDSAGDFYTIGSTRYYRSGIYRPGVPTGRPDGRYLNRDADIWEIRPERGDSALLRERIAQIISDKRAIKPLRLLTGATSSPSYTIKGAKTLQVVAFAPTVADGEGSYNEGIVVIDRDNNGDSAFADGIRQIWSDRGGLQVEGFSFIYNDSNSESRDFIAYDPASRVLTVDSTMIEGQPIIQEVDANLYDEHGNAIHVTWSGVGTWTASTTLPGTVPDPNARIYGRVVFRYVQGVGTQYDFEYVVKITDLDAIREYSFIQAPRDALPPLGANYIGAVASSSLDRIVLTGSSNEDDFYNNWELVVISGSYAGQTRRIIDYDGATHTAYLDSPFSVGFTARVSLSPLAINEESILIDGHGRGPVGSVRREIRYANSDGVVELEHGMIYVSDGSISGSILTGLSSGQLVDIVYFGDALQDGILAYLATPNSFDNFEINALTSGEFDVIGGFAIHSEEGSGTTNYVSSFKPYTHTPIALNWIGTVPSPWGVRYKPFAELLSPIETLNLTINFNVWDYVNNAHSTSGSHSDYFLVGMIVRDDNNMTYMICSHGNSYPASITKYVFPIGNVFNLIK